MTLTLTLGDAIAIAVCLISTLLLGFSNRLMASSSVIGFALAGRKLTIPLFVVTLVATWYGAVLAVGEFVWEYGIVVLLCFGAPYYIFGLAYAFFLAPRIRTSAAVSIPDNFRHTYGETAGRLSSLLVLFLTSPAPYVLMGAQVVSLIFGLPALTSILLVAIASFSYAAFGGFEGDVRANVAQIVFMYAGFALLLYFSIAHLGDLASLIDKAAPHRKSVPGGLGWMGIAGWWLLALQTFIDPNFHQRVSALHHPSMAKKGMVISVVLWMVFDFLTTTTALYAVSYTQVMVPFQAHLNLAEVVLPPVAKGVFVGAVLSAIMSTLDGYAIVHGLTISNDIISPIRKKSSSVAGFRNGLVLGGMLAGILAYAIPSVINLFFVIGAVSIPGLLLPLLISYSRTTNKLVKNISTRIIAPTMVSIIALIFYSDNLPTALFSGLLTSIILHMVDYWRSGE
jgi:solute:Na+ symporter, SSS family